MNPPNRIISIKIHKTRNLTWVNFEVPNTKDSKGNEVVSTYPLSPEDCTLLAKELIAAALELISIK